MRKGNRSLHYIYPLWLWVFSTRLYSLISLYIKSISIRFYHHTHFKYIASFPPFVLYPLHLLFILSSPKMVKFSKELEAQLIPEWKEAFVNYWQLKKQIKRIKLSRIPKQTHRVEGEFGLSIFDSLHSLVKNITRKLSGSHDHNNNLNIIQVN